jgi:hypothetical protein
MKYQCSKCLKEFSQKSNFDYHLKRARPCKPHSDQYKINSDQSKTNSDPIKQTQHQTLTESVNTIILYQKSSDMIKNISNLMCGGCQKIFSRKDALKRHILNGCKAKSENLIFKNIIEENNMLKQELVEIKNSIQESNNKKTIYNTQNNITINNYIVNHGFEDVNKLTSDENKQIINSNSEAIYNIVKHLHYNPRLPEYNNIYINNLRSNSVYVMVDGKFILEDKKTIISEMITRMAQNIEYISNQTKPISKKQRELLFDNFNWLKHFDFTDEDIDGNIIKSDKDLIEKYKKIYNKYELLLYNNRHMITNKDKILLTQPNNDFMDV